MCNTLNIYDKVAIQFNVQNNLFILIEFNVFQVYYK